MYLKTHDVTGSEGFLRCARHFFAEILTYFKENDAAHRKKARCPGALGVFRYTLGNSIDEITDDRGFEPLLFHFQGDFQWQRPFSEGCGGEIPEKTKKNLSQSYGRWIVGFGGPMTSAFFALKKGAENGGVLYDSKMAASH